MSGKASRRALAKCERLGERTEMDYRERFPDGQAQRSHNAWPEAGTHGLARSDSAFAYRSIRRLLLASRGSKVPNLVLHSPPRKNRILLLWRPGRGVSRRSKTGICRQKCRRNRLPLDPAFKRTQRTVHRRDGRRLLPILVVGWPILGAFRGWEAQGRFGFWRASPDCLRCPRVSGWSMESRRYDSFRPYLGRHQKGTRFGWRPGCGNEDGFITIRDESPLAPLSS